MTEKWQSDFSVFASEVEKLRKTKQGETSLESATGSRYENKQVKWTLTFKGISHNGDKDTVDFDLEPFGIKYKFFSSTRLIMAGFEPSPAAVPGWKNMKPGTHVGFAGVCESVSMLTMTPAGGVPRVVALVTVSGVTPITTAASPSVTGIASGKEPAKDVAKGLTGRWRFLMRTQTWTVQLAPRSGLPDEYKGLARREERDEKGEVVTMELGAALDGGKLKAWLGPGFVVCEAAFRAAPSLQGECNAMDGNTGPFRADRLAQGK